MRRNEMTVRVNMAVTGKHFLLLLCLLPVCRAGGGKLDFLMVSYQSNCDELFDGACDPYFKFCFDKPKSNPVITSCYYHQSPDSATYWDNTNIQFSNKIGDIDNPIVVTISSFEDPRVLVGIRMRDANRIDNDDEKVTFWRNLTLSPAPTREQASYVSDSVSKSGHTIAYKYKAYCTGGYEGSKCDCMPRDDATGHYTCSQTGDLECMTGWEGSNCLTDVNECERTPNVCDTEPAGSVVGATCLNIQGSYTCQAVCKEGWEGSNCGTDINECETTPDICQTDSTTTTTGNIINTTCLNTQGSYTCKPVCQEGWTGDNCDVDIDECAEAVTSFCENGGTCVNIDGSYRCDCPSSWTGANCSQDADECASDFPNRPCSGLHMACNNSIGSYQCVCQKGWRGEDCSEEIDECQESDITCHNGGTCVNYPGSYACKCAEGWEGIRCAEDINECTNASNPCENETTCENTEGSFTCFCSDGSIGCVRTDKHTGSGGRHDSTYVEERTFVWWPILLVIVILILVVIIVAIIFIRRRRRRQKEPIDDTYQPGEQPEPGTPTTPFKASSLNFENSLYNASSSKRKPRGSDIIEMKSNGAEPVGKEEGIYHDIDVEDGLKTPVNQGANWKQKRDYPYAFTDLFTGKPHPEKVHISMPLERGDDSENEDSEEEKLGKPYFGAAAFVNYGFDASGEEPQSPNAEMYANTRKNAGNEPVKAPTAPPPQPHYDDAWKTPRMPSLHHEDGRKAQNTAEFHYEDVRTAPTTHDSAQLGAEAPRVDNEAEPKVSTTPEIDQETERKVPTVPEGGKFESLRKRPAVQENQYEDVVPKTNQYDEIKFPNE